MLLSNSHGGGCVEAGNVYWPWAGDSLCSVAILPSFLKSTAEEQLDFESCWAAPKGPFGGGFLSKPGASLQAVSYNGCFNLI